MYKNMSKMFFFENITIYFLFGEKKVDFCITIRYSIYVYNYYIINLGGMIK